MRPVEGVAMRVAYVTETFLPSVDGVVTRMTKALEWLAAHGHDACVVAPDLGVREFAGFPVFGVPAVRYPLYRSRRWGTPSPAAWHAVRDFAPEVVHAWQPTLVGLPAVRGANRAHVPLVTSYHTDISSYLGYYGPLACARGVVEAYMRALNNRAPLTLVTSGAMRKKLDAAGFTGLRVLPRGVDLAARSPRFASADARERLSGGRPEAPLLVYVGRVAPEKGIGTLEPVMRAHPEWSLAVVGAGPDLDAMRAAFAGTHTTFTGFLAGEDLSRAFASADAFVFPSVTETLGLVILEAMASGVPVVAASSPATDEQVRSGENGLTYDPGRKGALEEALCRLLADDELRGQIRARGLAEAQGEGWDRASAALLDRYEETLDIYARGWNPPAHPSRRWAGQGGPQAPTPLGDGGAR